MKKQIAIFLCGLVAGMLIVVVASYFKDDTQGPGNLKVLPELYSKPGKCISNNNFKVFQALSPGYALAIELETERYSKMESASGVMVLFYDPQNKQFEDDEIIKVSKNKCVREIGVYTYGLRNGNKKTVPVVQIMDKDAD